MPQRSWVHTGAVVALVVGFSVASFLVGLGRYGLWEPWEVDRLELALATEGERPGPVDDDQQDQVSERLGDRLLVSAAEDERSEARLRQPMGAIAVVTLIVLFLIALATFDLWTGVFATVILAGLPLFLVTGRLLIFTPLPILAHALVVGGAAVVAFGRLPRNLNAVFGLLAVATGVTVGVQSVGVLFGAAGPLFAAALGLIVGRGWRRGTVELALIVTLGIAALIALWLAIDGGLFAVERSRGDPTFVFELRQILLGTFPWTGALIVGISALARPKSDDEAQAGAAGTLIVGVAVAVTLQTMLHQQAEGIPPMGIWALALGAGLLLSEARDGRPRRAAAVVCGLFVVLGLRDHVLEPDVALAALGDEGVSLPEEVGGRLWFVSVALLIGLPLVLALGRGREVDSTDFKTWLIRTFGWLLPPRRDQRRSAAWWLLPGGLALLLLHGIAAVALPGVLWFSAMGCLDRRIWFAAGALIPAIVALAVLAKLFWGLCGRVGERLVWVTAIAGAALALLGAHLALPGLSRHLSSREVVRVAEALDGADAEMLSYRAETRAAELAYDREIDDLASVEALVRRLTGPERVFAVVRAEDLARIDVRFRKHTGRHVPVAKAENVKTLLLASKLPEGKNHNPLDDVVLFERPTPSEPITANFERRIELIGLDVVGGGGGDVVCPAEAFTLRFYWHCLRSVPGRQKIFVHIDGHGQRINGDHEPADGLYEVRHWQEGDYIIDEQHLRVPMHFRPGNYSIYVGFFQGSKRMRVVDGPATSDNRAKAGVLRVR